MGIKSAFFARKCSLIFVIFFLSFSFLFSQSEGQKGDETEALSGQETESSEGDLNAKDGAISDKKNQNKNKSNYTFSILENGDLYFTQILEWQNIFGVLYYEVSLREKESGKLILDRRRTSENRTELNLSPGFYEYKIDAYNMLSRLESSSEWANIEVKKAHKPAIDSLKPSTIWIEDEKWVLQVYGKDIVEDAEIAFISDGLIKRTIKIRPDKMSDKYMEFHFKTPEMFLGVPYRLSVKDPSGVESVSGQFFVKYKRPVSFYFGAGYSPVMPVSDSFYKKYWSKPVYPASFNGTIGLIFSRQSYGYFGFSSKNTFRIINLKVDDILLKNRVFTSTFNLVYEWWFIKKRLSLCLSPGFGVALNKLQFVYTDGVNDVASFVDPMYSLNIGLRSKVQRFLYLDVSLRIEQILNKDTKPLFVVPEISFGFRY